MGLFKKKQVFCAPCSGKIIPLCEVNDPVFAGESLGPGFAIIPSKGELYAPKSGVVSAIFPTKHAVGMTFEDGSEVLFHIGIDTVNLQGEGFSTFVNSGDKVKQGSKLVDFDLPFLESKSIDSTVMVVFTKHKEVSIESKTVQANEALDITCK